MLSVKVFTSSRPLQEGRLVRLIASFCLTGSEDSFDEIQESDVIRSQPVGQIAFGAQSPTARLPEVALVTGEEGEKHIVQVQLAGDKTV